METVVQTRTNTVAPKRLNLFERYLTVWVGLCKPIVDAVSVAAIEDETGVLQVLQMTRHIRLRGVEHILDIAAAEFSMQEEIQHSKSIDVGETFEIFL